MLFIFPRSNKMRKCRPPKELNLSKDTVIKRRNERKANRKAYKLSSKNRKKSEALKQQGLITEQNKDSLTLSFVIKSFESFEEKNECNELSVIYKAQKTAIKLKTLIPHLNHLDWFWYKLQTKQLPSNLMFFLFPNCKEISESVSAFRTVLYYQKLSLTICTILVIGDGIKPRTASLFAFGSHPQSFIAAIDPLMRINNHVEFPNNLFLYQMKIEDWINENYDILESEKENLVIIGVHSHARFDDYMDKLFSFCKAKNVIIFTMKCCSVQQSFNETQIRNYKLKQVQTNFDWGVFSPSRHCMVWQSI